MKVIMIRHGVTLGNVENRYMGSTDIPILPDNIDVINSRRYPYVDKIYSSPMIRCLQTASYTYPNRDIIVVHGLKEYHFGDFEGKTYDELKDNPEYTAWIDAKMEISAKNGEDINSFKYRCYSSFLDIVNGCSDKDHTVAVVSHGGVIMAIMAKFANESKFIYDWQVKNLEGYTFDWDYKKQKAVNVEPFTGIN